MKFENFHFYFFGNPNSQISRFPDFQVPRNLAWAGLGPGLGRAGLEVWAGWALRWAAAASSLMIGTTLVWITIKVNEHRKRLGAIQGQPVLTLHESGSWLMKHR